jgi:hypothetical protein
MNSADQYRVKAAELLTLAHGVTDPHLQLKYISMAQTFLDLAALADNNSQTDLVYETPKRPSS